MEVKTDADQGKKEGELAERSQIQSIVNEGEKQTDGNNNIVENPNFNIKYDQDKLKSKEGSG